MAFPSIRSQQTTVSTVTDASPNILLPATIAGGDTIVVAIRSAVAGAIGWPDATWVELVDDSPDGSDDQIAIAWKRAVGGEGGTTITLSSGTGKFVAIAIAVQDAANPTITPPFLGTAGTGTTPNQPDAGDCNPAAGAKDYLWWTAYSMEGEQTGVTSYPANYTLSQSGFINTSTSGLPATNCTAASAARQLNASSENVGVWSIAGTLINWTARTIAFTPASAVTAPLDREAAAYMALPHARSAWSRLAYAYPQAFIIPNLLLSTLGSPDLPFVQKDWPVSRPGTQIIGFTETTPEPVAAAEFPIGQAVWSPPRSLPPAGWSFTASYISEPEAVVEVPFNQTSWPPVIRLKRPTTSSQWSRPPYFVDQYPVGKTEMVGGRPAPRGPQAPFGQSLALTTVVAALPFGQTSWPPPPPLGGTRAWVASRPGPDIPSQPFIQTAWPGSQAAPRAIQAVVAPGLALTIPVGERPFTQSVWPGSLRTNAAQTWTETLPTPAAVDTPFVQTAWPGAVLVRPPARSSKWSRPEFFVDQYPIGRSEMAGARTVKSQPSWQIPNLPRTSVGVPFSQTDWPGSRPTATIRVQSWARPVAQDVLPFTQTDWPSAKRAAVPALSSSWSRPAFFVDQYPVGKSELKGGRPGIAAVPALQPQNLTPLLLVPPDKPFLQNDWPGTVRVKPPSFTWNWTRPAYFVDQFPVGESALEGVRRVPPTLTTAPPNTLPLLTATVEKPIGASVFGPPAPARAQSYGYLFYLIEEIEAAPFNQTEWPRAVRVKQNTFSFSHSRSRVLVDQFPVGKSEMRGARRAVPGVPAVMPTGRGFYLSDQFPVGNAEMRGARRAVPGVPPVYPPNLGLLNTPIITDPFVQTHWPLSAPARRTIPTPVSGLGAPVLPPPERQPAGCMLVGSYARVIALEGSA